LAQRCGAVAEGQTERAKPAKGRADLRAAKHSGGRPIIKGGHGPQKNQTEMKKTMIALAIVLGLIIGGFVLKEVVLQEKLKSWQKMGLQVETEEQLSDENLSREMAKKWLNEEESLAGSLRKTIMEMDDVFKYVEQAKAGGVKNVALLFELQRKIDTRMPLIIKLPLVQNNKNMLKTLGETEEAYSQWKVDYKSSKYFRIMTYTNSVRRAQISNLVGTLEREKQQKAVKK